MSDQHAVSAHPRPKLLVLTNHPIEDGSSRYRIYQFLPYLQAAGLECEIRPFSSPALFRALRRRGQYSRKTLLAIQCAIRRFLDLSKVTEFDVVLIHREAFPFCTPMVERMVLERHPNVVFSFDDAIYVGHGETERLNHPWLYKLKYGTGIDEVLRRSAYVIAANSVLASYAERLNPNVAVIPTVVDLDVYRPANSELHDNLTVGWIGSGSTSPYIFEIEPALQRLAEAHPGKLRFRFFGDPDLRLRLPNFEARAFNIHRELDDLRSLDIGIMPMPDTPWTRGKSAFKAIQYMAMGIPTVVSPVGVASELVQHGVNGFTAGTMEEWFSCLEELFRDSRLREKFAVAGRETIAARYSLQIWGPRFADLLLKVAHDRQTEPCPA